MINVSKLTKQYGPRTAINEIDFQINKGEIVGFLGPNGAGKTTTMRILTGYIPPTSGNAEIGGFDIIEQSLEMRRIVGYLPETIPLYPDMTVFEYLMYMAQLRSVKEAKTRVGEVLELVHMEARAEGYIANLSKGMVQRIGLAQALLHHPQVLILDEPTIGLDPVQIIEVRNMIREIGKEHTVLLSTHILPEAQQVCDRVLIINNGRIVADDSTQHLQARLTGAQRGLLRVRGAASELIPQIASIPGVTSVIPKNGDGLEFESAPGEDIRAEVARRVVQAQFDLIELQSTSMSLEEIFLQLTRDEPVPPPIDDTSDPENA